MQPCTLVSSLAPFPFAPKSSTLNTTDSRFPGFELGFGPLDGLGAGVEPPAWWWLVLPTTFPLDPFFFAKKEEEVEGTLLDLQWLPRLASQVSNLHHIATKTRRRTSPTLFTPLLILFPNFLREGGGKWEAERRKYKEERLRWGYERGRGEGWGLNSSQPIHAGPTLSTQAIGCCVHLT